MAKQQAERPPRVASEEDDEDDRDDATEAGSPAPVDDGRPLFARDFPRTPELDEIVAAFIRGDYRRVRSAAPALAASTTDESVREAARVLRRRIDPDPVSVALVLIAILLLAVLSFHYLGSHHLPAVTQ